MRTALLFISVFMIALLPFPGSGFENHMDTNRKLPPCPDSPNCVSSQSTDEAHYIAPLSYEGDATRARQALLSIIQSMDRANIVTAEDNYIHAEFTSLVFRFVDDVEFYLNADNNTIDVRSASRKGHYDFGVNRKRIEAIRKQLNETLLRQESETDGDDT